MANFYPHLIAGHSEFEFKAAKRYFNSFDKMVMKEIHGEGVKSENIKFENEHGDVIIILGLSTCAPQSAENDDIFLINSINLLIKCPRAPGTSKNVGDNVQASSNSTEQSEEAIAAYIILKSLKSQAVSGQKILVKGIEGCTALVQFPSSDYAHRALLKFSAGCWTSSKEDSEKLTLDTLCWFIPLNCDQLEKFGKDWIENPTSGLAGRGKLKILWMYKGTLDSMYTSALTNSLTPPDSELTCKDHVKLSFHSATLSVAGTNDGLERFFSLCRVLNSKSVKAYLECIYNIQFGKPFEHILQESSKVTLECWKLAMTHLNRQLVWECSTIICNEDDVEWFREDTAVLQEMYEYVCPSKLIGQPTKWKLCWVLARVLPKPEFMQTQSNINAQIFASRPQNPRC